MKRNEKLVLGLLLACSVLNGAAAAATAKSSSSHNSSSSNVTSSTAPSTLAKNGPSQVCACAAGTYDSTDCTTAVQKYCIGNKTADVTFCGGMMNLAQLKTNQTAAAGVSGFLAAMCRPAGNNTLLDACTCFTVGVFYD